MMQNRKIAAEIAHNVSARKRVGILTRAKQLKITLINPKARVLVEEVE